ncbi:S8 family serine peptidase [Pontibacter akesuensis]|uniref:S8 family serine peptidase n=1 Tax=Pontibacter akesuensis TaxID=388950 RepID=UPI0015611875|nr:S8 family serine peptidase [Pontibacter akesuensis]
MYRLKPQQPRLMRSGQENGMRQALQRIGAEQVQPKFPAIAAKQAIATARQAAPSADLSLIYELKYGTAHTFEEVKTALMATGQVAYVEPLYIREPFHQPNDPASDSTKTTQYYLKQVQAYGGWAAEKGDTTMVIGILDTGVRLTHQDLQSKVKYNYADPVDGIDNDGNGLIDDFAGWDFADKDNNVADDSPWTGHGTAVAGVAAAATNNGTGMAGMGYNARFMPLKIFSSHPNGPFGGYEAIVYAADNGCKVINLSWGGTSYSQFEQDVINYAVLEKDVLIIASAGNTNADLDFYPASYENVVSVGGANNKDVKYKDHTYSYKIDLISPSINIYAPSAAGDTKYGNVGGTSFSAPTVAGGAALVRHHFPDLNARQVAERLRSSTDNIYTLEGNKPYLEMLGTGRFNLKKALTTPDLKSIRCTKLAPVAKQNLAAGKTIRFAAEFINLLAPTTALEVTLTSLSPYVTVKQSDVNLGSIGTMVSASTEGKPFVLKIEDNAPIFHKVYLRLGFKDGDYESFQHFELVINPDFATLNANNLRLTLNSLGNIGYNGLKMQQGVGVTYGEGASMLFEGGLMVATEAGVVADNLHNADWQNDNNFTPLHLTSQHFETPQADQEIRSLMETKVTGHPLVEVKTVGFAWADAANQDYVIIEYQITNRSSDTIQQLHTGLFADWDIGRYTRNIAAWDSQLQLGYVYNPEVQLPYAGIKLLTPEQQVIYHAIDNIGGNDSTVSVDDGFTNEEKYKIISNGTSRLRAGGKTGNNVSHVVGGTSINLAPGQVKTIAFAVLAGHNLEALQQHAQAAQQKYISIRTGPLPVATAFEACLSGPAVVAPEGGSNFNFYADADAKNFLGTGKYFTIPSTAQNTTIYAANADSMFSSMAVPMEIQVIPAPKADFSFLTEYPQVNAVVQLKDRSQDATAWEWDFGDGTTSTAQHPQHAFQKPGSYNVKLTVTDKLNCQRHTISQTIAVFDTAPKLYPNPVRDYLAITLTRPLTADASTAPMLQLTDVTGKAVSVTFLSADNTNFKYDLSTLAPGVYFARITYLGKTFVERVLVQ